jgi:deazaflavin-dependent oxidoreductase (nitroreductase family)
MSDNQIPRPNYLMADKWAMLIGNRTWKQTPDGWVETSDMSQNMLIQHRGAMAQADAARYTSTKGPWVAQGGPTCMLTTVGRKSGEERTASVNYMPYAGSFIAVGSLAGLPLPPQWALNLEHTPRGRIQLKEHRWDITSTILTSAETQRLWPVLTSVFPLWHYFQRHCQREFKLFRLTPV